MPLTSRPTFPVIDLQPDHCIQWLREVFGFASANDVEERLLRLGEETLELMQSRGVTREQAHALVEQVFNNPPGQPLQELGGVMVTLASYCAVDHQNPSDAFGYEFARCQQPDVKLKIKAKHATKAVVSSHRP